MLNWKYVISIFGICLTMTSVCGCGVVTYELDGKKIQSVSISAVNDSQYSVDVQLKEDDRKDLENLIAKHFWKELQITFSNRVLSSTLIRHHFQLDKIIVDERDTREAAVELVERILLDENGDSRPAS